MSMYLPLVACAVALSLGSCGAAHHDQTHPPVPADRAAGSLVVDTAQPGLGMTLGRGYDPTKPLEPKGDCLAGVDAATITSWKTAGGLRGDFTETRLQSWSDLQREVSLSGTVSAETLWGGGGASLAKYEKFRSDGSSFTWLVNFVVDVGEKTLDGRRLTLVPAAKALVDAGRLDDFYQMCGTQFIRSVKLGGKVTLVYEIEARYTDLVQRLAATVQAHVDAGPWGFSGSAAFQSFFRDAVFASALKREVQQLGGSVIDVASLTPDHLGATLTTFQQQLRSDDAVVVEVETAPWETLGVRGLDRFADWHRKTTVDALYGQYRHNTELLSRISDFVYWQDQHVHLLPKATLDGLNVKKAQLDAQQTEIARRGSACLSHDECDLTGLPLIDVAFPPETELGVEEDFQSLVYAVPEAYAKYGSSESYDGQVVRFYDVPVSVHQEPGVRQLNVIVYETPCAGAADWLSEQRGRLADTGGTKVGAVERVNGSGPGAYQLSWQDDRLSRLVAFEPSPTGLCAVIKVGVSGDGVSWDRMTRLATVLELMEATMEYRESPVARPAQTR